MRYKKVKYPYADFRAGDVVCCDTRSVFSMLTRIFTAGPRHVLDHDTSTHTGILFEVGGQLLIAEMNGRTNRLEVNSLEKYNAWDLRVISIRRPDVTRRTVYEDCVQRDIGELIRRSIEYDYKGLLEFVTDRARDSRARNYCSEMVYLLTRDHVANAYPREFAKKVSPEDLRTCRQMVDVWHR